MRMTLLRLPVGKTQWAMQRDRRAVFYRYTTQRVTTA
jgi:hypothetical protein